MSYGCGGGYGCGSGGSPAYSGMNSSAGGLGSNPNNQFGGLEHIAYVTGADPGLSYIGSTGGFGAGGQAGYGAGAGYSGNAAAGYSNASAFQHQAEGQAAFIADDFLDPFRPKTPFIGDAESIRPHVEQAFEALTGSKLPADIIVRVGSEQQCAKAYPGDWQSNIKGFAMNRVGWGTSEIFVVHDDMDRLLLTVGHELGHVMSKSLPRELDEEAKAFAFSAAWMDTIKKNNIAGIGHSINPNPAQNGLHNVAMDFVVKMVNAGKEALTVFVELANRVLIVT